jgi:antitoxin CptB
LQNIAQTKDAEQRRLAWRCRRGLLELDIVLQRFIATHFYDLSMQELATFDALLALPDNDFWNLLQQKNSCTDAAQKKVLDKLIAI